MDASWIAFLKQVVFAIIIPVLLELGKYAIKKLSGLGRIASVALITAGLLLLVYATVHEVAHPQFAKAQEQPSIAPTAKLPESGNSISNSSLMFGYRCFALTRWAYDDTTVERWYGLGFLWYLIRLCATIVALCIDALIALVLLPAALWGLVGGVIGRNFYVLFVLAYTVHDMLSMRSPDLLDRIVINEVACALLGAYVAGLLAPAAYMRAYHGASVTLVVTTYLLCGLTWFVATKWFLEDAEAGAERRPTFRNKRKRTIARLLYYGPVGIPLLIFVGQKLCAAVTAEGD